MQVQVGLSLWTTVFVSFVKFVMAGGGATSIDLSRKFVSETELDEKRKKRQEEWEKVRKPDDPEGKDTYTQAER